MKDETIKILDIVALLKDLPNEKLLRGQIGTVVERYSDTDFEVEFSDNNGKTIFMLTLNTGDIMLLHNELVSA
ncbi:DUF4926 domain-containing protein [Pedobacter sp. BS3]|uniref:DUF4926 domain-containing protein n=1 Tax=Pedobacter sp. BS3 TaxID=2567937 RepID=UPI0011ECD627|nr:DUF4926 domain-containing protein [Pedobacter sp. BS3]TZF82685.1 DUF4926 domain-containing protein [Pedobacter sp. BS3]